MPQCLQQPRYLPVAHGAGRQFTIVHFSSPSNFVFPSCLLFPSTNQATKSSGLKFYFEFTTTTAGSAQKARALPGTFVLQVT